MRSIDAITLKGDLLIRKIFTMRNSIEDSDGYYDPETIQIDDIPKTVQFTPSLDYIGQVITADRIVDSSDAQEEENKIRSTQESFSSENRTGYKYAFGTRVKEDEEFDKGLGIVGMNKQSLNQRQISSSSKKSTSSQNRVTASSKMTNESRASKNKTSASAKSKPQQQKKPLKGILK